MTNNYLNKQRVLFFKNLSIMKMNFLNRKWRGWVLMMGLAIGASAQSSLDIASDTTWLTPQFANNTILPCAAITSAWNSNVNYDETCWTTAIRPYPDSVQGVSRYAQYLWGRNPWIPGQTAYFRKTFTLSALPTTATLRFRADDSGKLYINGHKVAQVTWWDQVAIISTDSILPYLVVGKNIIAVEATDLGAVGWNFGSNLHLESNSGCTLTDYIRPTTVDAALT
ncbi:MAG: hypothetical protein RIS64_4370, partial [Bacteroidota bacterium]